MRIFIFLHGTSIMHSADIGCTRQQRARQLNTDDDCPSGGITLLV